MPQKQLRAQEATIVQEKAAKIKEWVTFKLREVSPQPAVSVCDVIGAGAAVGC